MIKLSKNIECKIHMNRAEDLHRSKNLGRSKNAFCSLESLRATYSIRLSTYVLDCSCNDKNKDPMAYIIELRQRTGTLDKLAVIN